MTQPITAANLNELLHTLAEDNFPEDRVCWGQADAAVKGVLVTWMPSAAALEYAGARGLNTVVCHENLLFTPSGAESKLVSEEAVRGWPTNAGRLALIEKYGLTVIQCHRTLDAWCIGVHWGRDVLGLGEPVVSKGARGYMYIQVYEIEPVAAGELIEGFKKKLGLRHIRAHVPDAKRPIRCIGNAWGGIGNARNIYTSAQILLEGVDMVIAGETDETAAYFYAEAGVDLVELGHNCSESPGVFELAPWLKEKLGVPVKVFRDRTPLEII